MQTTNHKITSLSKILLAIILILTIAIPVARQAPHAYAATPYFNSTKPVLQSLENTKQGIRINWYARSSTKGYKLYRAVGKANFKLYKTIKGGIKEAYTDKSVKSGITYRYKLKAFQGKKQTPFSAGKQATWLVPPANVSIQPAEKGAVLSWSATPGAKSYRVYRETVAGTWYQCANVKTLAYEDLKVLPGATWRYMVKACKGKTTSAESASISITL